ncbi:DUF5709 domain-containing protein [Kribbella sp. CA-245084]
MNIAAVTAWTTRTNSNPPALDGGAASAEEAAVHVVDDEPLEVDEVE